jgi:hypothetical protein
VEVDAAEVDDPGERGSVVADGKVGGAPAREADMDRLEPVRMGLRYTLLVEEEAVDAVGVPLHLHRPVAHVVEQAVGHVDVVLNEIALRQPELREEDLVRVRDPDVAAGDAHCGQVSVC